MTDKPHLGADVRHPGSIRVWRAGFDAEDDRRLLTLWRRGHDTLTIAALMLRSEAEVHNRLMRVRGTTVKQQVPQE